MSVAFSPGTDFEDITDGLEAVTLNRRGSSDNVSVTAALRRALSTSEISASDGLLRSGDTWWHLPAAEVATTAPPRMGDWIIPTDGTRFQIMELRLDTQSTRWRCIARDVRVSYGLDDTIQIQEAVYDKGGAGAQEASWRVHLDGVRARIQEVDAEVAVAGDAKRTERTYGISVESDLDLLLNHRIKDRKGKLYRIIAVTGRDAIGEPMVIEATQWR